MNNEPRPSGWRTSPGQNVELSPSEEEDTRRELYLQWLLTLAPLTGNEFELRPLPESKPDGRTLTGVSVRRAGSPHVQLFFDQESGLLSRVFVPRWVEAGQQKRREIIISKHKKVDDMTLPAALIDRRDGERYLEWETIDYRFERIDEKLFERP